MKRIIYTLAILLLIATESMGRQKVGVVFGGGGAKGAAEVGVLKYIEEAGIPIDYIAGTSIGSIVGGLYACGYRSQDLESMFCSQNWITLLSDRNMDLRAKPIKKQDGVTYVFGFPIGRKGSELEDTSVGLVRGDNVVQLLDSMICLTGAVPCHRVDGNLRVDSISFDQLPIPFRCIATDYQNGREVVLSEGSLSRSMRASMAIPGAFKAIDIDGVELLDGGLINNLPVDVVRDMGADIVIAIDLTQNKHEDEDSDARAKKKIFKNPKTEIGQLLNWVKSRPDLSRYKDNAKNADIYINPDLEGYGAASFSLNAVTDMISRGEKAGKEALPQLKELKRKLDQEKM